jgi:hypothetical protein
MGRPSKYTPEQIRFVKDNITRHTYAEMRDLFNRRFGLSITGGQMKGILDNHKIRSGLRLGRFQPVYTPDQIQFLRDNIAGRTHAEMTDMFNRRFGLSITMGQMKDMLVKRKIRNGLHLYPVGAERTTNYYVEVKTADHQAGWELKHHLIWEQANGPIPDGHVVIFSDGNRFNFDLDNLLLVTASERTVMNHLGLIYKDKDATKAGKAVARLIMAIHEREREIGKRRKKREYKRKGNEQDSETGARRV